MNMGNVQARLPDDLERDLEALAEELHTSRSEALRRALDQGLQAIRLDRAIQAYVSEEMTLSAAASYAGVSLPRMAQEAADRGIPRFRQDPSSLDRDVEAVESSLEESQADGAG